ncbi:MAG: nuclear transport factor 2 family protein [Kofleriaceae bacterium]|nr:nuclear transport factor 2 family protein [Kofleriaceae bacterium]
MRSAASARLAIAAAVALSLLACDRTKKRTALILPDQIEVQQRDPRLALQQDLIAEVLDSYERDAPPEIQMSLLNTVGIARIGVGPGDLLAGDDMTRAPSRWPLLLDEPAAVVSKLLRVQVSTDLTSAWVSDEISWRIPACGRMVVIPLRLTALYARDGERWVNVVEHLSYGHEPVALDTGLRGKTPAPAVVSRRVADEVSRSIAPMLSGRMSPSISRDADAVALGPRWQDEFRGAMVGVTPVTPMRLLAEERRVGVVGRDTTAASVAYWVGTLIGQTPTGKVRLRGTFVLERRDDAWVVVQSHISSPVDDEELAQRILGTALEGLNPLRVACGRR